MSRIISDKAIYLHLAATLSRRTEIRTVYTMLFNTSEFGVSSWIIEIIRFPILFCIPVIFG
ncbi:MAG: hypothetical protein PQJ61_16900 [Spirochaetales bacterium]|uniref:Uncharacterized protein n=1 Tax=Candidatus Thalassospirochaeta sargassi TaxID=3119039 RepID=A0AAJ1IFM4_9SPIO|nr:hypothetical protein [Spirochaetales bacterium]